MAKRPSPPVPADLSIGDFEYMPLFVQRLRDSDLAIDVSAEAFRASVLLWCAAWDQVPAGSIPDNDRRLAVFTFLPLDEWSAIRDEVLARWTLCSDGRWYHEQVCDLAMKANRRRRRKRENALAGWAKRKAQENQEVKSTRIAAAEQSQCKVREGKVREGKVREGKGREGTGKRSEATATARRVFDSWNEFGPGPVHRDAGFDRFRAKLVKALKQYSEAEIAEAIKNYRTMLEGGEYRWEAKYTELGTFLSKGLPQFVPENWEATRDSWRDRRRAPAPTFRQEPPPEIDNSWRERAREAGDL